MSSNTINFNDYLTQFNQKYFDKPLSLLQSLELLHQNTYDIIGFPYESSVLLIKHNNNIKNENNKFYLDIFLDRDCEYANNLKVDIGNINGSISLYYDNTLYNIDDNNDLIFMADYKGSIHIRIEFNEKPEFTINDIIKISCNKYVCNNNIRKTLNTSNIQTNFIYYKSKNE